MLQREAAGPAGRRDRKGSLNPVHEPAPASPVQVNVGGTLESWTRAVGFKLAAPSPEQDRECPGRLLSAFKALEYGVDAAATYQDKRLRPTAFSTPSPEISAAGMAAHGGRWRNFITVNVEGETP